MSVFVPNLTSRLLAKACLTQPHLISGNVLEIGCGSGWITVQLLNSESNLLATQFFLSDVSGEATEAASRNLQESGVRSEIRQGRGLEPWRGLEFDLIINDAAGICDAIARESDWYQGVPYAAGESGLDNSLEVLHEIEQSLSESGKYVVPLISLSDVERHRSELEHKFSRVEYLLRTWWPLPEWLQKKTQLIEHVIKNHKVEIISKYGTQLAFTEVAVCAW